MAARRPVSIETTSCIPRPLIFVHPVRPLVLSCRSCFPFNMTDWKSPAVIAAEYFALIKLCHAMSGILFWEIVANIGFEYSVFTGKRKFRSSFLAYGISVFLFAHISIASASALIVLRVVAIWGLNKIATSIASIAWLANTGSLIHSVVVVHAAWSDSEGCCKITNPSETKINIPVTLVTDLVLLVLMLIGLLRWEYAHQRGGIWWLLFTQGLAWMIIVTLAEALITVRCLQNEYNLDDRFPQVFILLNLNDAMNLMFMVPALMTMTICASRMYRGLADYFLHNEANVHIIESLSKPIGFLAPRSSQTSLALGTSGMPDSHSFVMEPLAPPKHHFRPGENNEVW
ncbi:hypothetical protein EDB83DRAFT_2548032 [Lactarius deliciosus]|nr:hypothetical protein EDB83DRAFT_2548032 [Lactarius deliciosus]